LNLKEKIKNLPSSPGVYLMKDSLQIIIYVGKSKNLKSRVASYFVNSKSHSPKVVKLVKNIKDFEYILTDTEFEAFILECKLIKKIKPIYNKKMRSPLSYTYIKIDKDYSNIKISNDTVIDDRSFYFGPYTSKSTVETALQGIKEYYKIMCSGNYKKASTCLNYSLGSCIGYCFDASAKEKYKNILCEIIDLLNGTNKSILEGIVLNMNVAAEKFDFETAAKYRDYMSTITYLINREKVLEFTKENKYIALFEYLHDDSFKFFLISGNRVLFSEKYTMPNSDIESLKLTLRNNILHYFKTEALNVLIKIGRDEIDEAQIIYSYLKSKQNNCRYIVVSEEWIDGDNNSYIDEALSILFAFLN
jgi:excinuclease ABC subunit C